ncbi:MAG: hypothetical protein ABS62_08790 [Microbacterium sp. SCN 70-200]|uniref:hypothetical protein n=1 Tax=unclassified Microbacterium TaxID=2609290 RepID=UPI00086A46CB|nr:MULTISPECIES: hypothetical protein [unclassified Microbacterium]MBN9213279.1 hypothetical protein [Microbacterium sp.]ODT40659.1 MAG: hypothetical protein ABS62_08790 [Microbacterium sp. SCN 70-200]OJV83656.1 MAG: hypothetical protein BGO46_11535 [Microbacterium sp. 70-16]
MSTPENLPETPAVPDLAKLRKEIDDLQSQSPEELVNPTPEVLKDREATPEPTDAIGSEDWGDEAP